MANDIPSTCPRCRAAKTSLLARSATSGVWSMFRCETCLYTWRSTEPIENTDPERYPAVFRLSPDMIPGLPAVPVIPPLRDSD